MRLDYSPPSSSSSKESSSNPIPFLLPTPLALVPGPASLLV